MNAKRDPGKREVLTAMSYLLQHYEGVSREAKREWLRARGCSGYSLQHDGVMASLVLGMTPEAAASGMSKAASEATGLAVCVEVKSAPVGDDSLAFNERPPCRLRPQATGEIRREEGEVDERAAPPEVRSAFQKAVGASGKRDAPRLTLPGPDQLTRDGSTRRVVLSYKKGLPVEQRSWSQKVEGGFHEKWEGKGAEWLRWARSAYTIANGGRLVGERNHPQCPLAAIFWWECDKVVREANKKVDAKESRFVFDKMLEMEAAYPVTHFVASDGSRKERDQSDPVTRVGRAALSVSRQGVTTTNKQKRKWRAALRSDAHMWWNE